MINPIENEMTFFELMFEYSPFINTEDAELKEILKLLEGSTRENEQKEYMKQIVDIYKMHTENLQARNILLEFFTKYGSKKGLKKYLQDIISELDLSTSLLKSTTDEILENINNFKFCNVKQCYDLIGFVTLMQTNENFQNEVTIEYMFPVCCILFEGFVHHISLNSDTTVSVSDDSNLYTLMNALLKQILFGLAKDVPYSKTISEQYSVKLIVMSYSVLTSEKLGFDLKTKSGLIISYCCNLVPEMYRNNFKYKDCPPLELVVHHNSESDFTLSNYKLPVLKESETIAIIYSSILSVLAQDKLIEIKIDGETLVSLLFNGLMECARRKTSVPHVVVEISRTLTVLGKHLMVVPAESMKLLFLEAIAYIWANINHFVDTVRSYTKLFFSQIVMMAACHYQNGNSDYASILIKYVKELTVSETIRYLTMENIAQYFGASYLLQCIEDLQDILLSGFMEPTISDQACKTYIVIMERHFEEIERKEEWVEFWVIPITKILKGCNKYTAICHKILLKAYQLQPTILTTVYPVDYIGNPQEISLQLKCLHFAKHNGIYCVCGDVKECSIYWRGLINKEKLMKFMVHQDDEIRLSVLAVMVESQKSTEAFYTWEFDFLILFLHYNITTQVPNVRKQIITYYKKAITRYTAGYYVLQKSIAALKKKIPQAENQEELKKALAMYENYSNSYRFFIEKLTKILITFLTFDSNYYRRAATLELLLTLQKLLDVKMWLACWNEDDIKNCHNILFDSYESNKKMAVALLKTLPSSAIGFTNIEFTFKYMQRCLNMAVDIKPNKTLSAAYLLEVCTYSPHFPDILDKLQRRKSTDPKLDMIIVLIGKLFAEDVKLDEVCQLKTAHYGVLLCIRHLLELREISKNNREYAEVFEHTACICLNLKDGIMKYVCDPAPEGFLPDSAEEFCDKDLSAKAQKILCYAWRTMKEITLLFAEIVKQTVKLEGTIEMLHSPALISIGSFFFNIFVESKHKGVFEKAFVGFSVICTCFWSSTNSNINCLPKQWLEKALNYCTGEQQTEKLCSTRRSAGLPFLILAILSTEPSIDKPNFHEAMKTLLKTCANTDPSRDKYRIHSMNVLRMLYRHSKLGEAVAPYVAEGVRAIISCFRNNSWGIRNAATLMFASLMTRIFGVQRTQDSEDLSIKNRLTVRVFFSRYPELFPFMLDALSSECSQSHSIALHPLLMILARLYPSHLEEYNVQMEEYIPHITKVLSDPFYRTRSLAARAIVPLIRIDSISKYVENCFNKLTGSKLRDNECQGLLLQIWHIIKSNSNLDIPLSKCLKDSIHLLEYVGSKYSHFTVSLYMEVLLMLLMKFRDYDDIDVLKEILTLLSRLIPSKVLPMTSMSKFPQMRMLLFLFIVVNKFEECDVTYSTISHQIILQLYGHNMEMKSFCLYLLIYLSQIQNGPATRHALFQLEELQVPPEIVTVVDSFDRQSIKKILTHIHPYLKYFLTEEIKFQHYIKKEDQVLLFLLLNYYPCVIKYLNLSKQETLSMLIKLCHCDNEELISAVVSCISTFLLQLDYNVLSYSQLIQILMESASPAASDYRRLTVCDFLTKNYILYCNEEPILRGDELQMVLNIIMVLLEDDEVMVRNAMSSFSSLLKVRITLNRHSNQTVSGQRFPMVPGKARDDLLNFCFFILPRDRAICFLFSWACRHFPDASNDASEVFERGELNSFAENVPMVSLCFCLLYQLLWPLEHGLNYEDKSIFLEEHTLIVTTILLDSLSKHPSPMMLYKTKLSVICALKSIVKFLERYEISNNFVNEFRTYIDETILSYLSKQVDHSDLFNVKRVLRKIYEPVFIHNRV